MENNNLSDKISALLNNVKTVAVICLQWGDSGKGKVVDLLAGFFDLIIRGQGADNAGHTVVADGDELIFHLIPSGIKYDSEGKINALGSGVAFNPKTFCGELAMLDSKKLSYNNLMVSMDAKLILPQHLVLDRIRESSSGSFKIGTTGRGVAPAYGDHYLRKGLTVNDLLNKDVFAKKLKENLQEKIRLLKTHDIELIKKIMSHEHLLGGIYFHPKKIFDEDAIIEQYMQYGATLKDMIRDTDALVKTMVGIKRILLEGAQGSLLSIDYGTYPYVTSSDPTAKGLIKGVGLNEVDVDFTLGIIKGFYETRVGGGPFPTEFGGKASESWCSLKTLEDEDSLSLKSVNDPNEMDRGIAIRRAGNEYGATTRRPRRTGRLDLPLLRRALLTSLTRDLVLTKVDVLNKCKEIEICTHYVYEGPNYRLGEKVLKNGQEIHVAINRSEVLEHCRPVYEKFPGWECDLSGAESFGDLPGELREIFTYVKEKEKVNLRILSIGADRNDTVIL